MEAAARRRSACRVQASSKPSGARHRIDGCETLNRLRLLPMIHCPPSIAFGRDAYFGFRQTSADLRVSLATPKHGSDPSPALLRRAPSPRGVCEATDLADEESTVYRRSLACKLLIPRSGSELPHRLPAERAGRLDSYPLT